MDREDEISQVDAPRANQLAFAAEHAFHHFLLQLPCFAPPEEGMETPDVKTGKMPGRAGGSTTPALHTNMDGRLCSPDIIHDLAVIQVIVDLPVLADRITEGNL